MNDVAAEASASLVLHVALHVTYLYVKYIRSVQSPQVPTPRKQRDVTSPRCRDNAPGVASTIHRNCDSCL
jgi:hypothetical protein